MFLIVGLGNPGGQYQRTRHNVGFIAADILSDRYNFFWTKSSKFKSDIAEGHIYGNKVMLCKPATFMNLSGQAVRIIATYYKIPPKKILVIYDDVDLKLGQIRCKVGGGSAGHNGIKSIDQELGNLDYFRIRIGIGRPENSNLAIADYVLQQMLLEEEQIIIDRLKLLGDNINLLFTGDMDKFKKACEAT